MNEVMGSKENGTKYITILRDPVDLLESAWGFYSFETKFGMSLGNESTPELISHESLQLETLSL